MSTTCAAAIVGGIIILLRGGRRLKGGGRGALDSGMVRMPWRGKGVEKGRNVDAGRGGRRGLKEPFSTGATG